MKKAVLAWLMLGAVASAQTHTAPALDTTNVFTGTNTISSINGTVNAALQSGSNICAQINTAVQSFSSLGGGVLVPAKTGGYSACSASIIIDRPIHLYCDGGGGTYGASYTNCALRFAAGVRGLWIKPSAYGRVVIESLAFQGSDVALGTNDGILNQANGTNIRNVGIDGFGRDGLHSDSADLGAGVGNADGGHYENVFASNNFRFGFDAENPDANTSIYTATKATSNGNYGYNILTPSNVFINPVATNNGLVAGVGDYNDNSLGNRWIFPYSEGGRGFVVGAAETDATIDVSQFGQPTFSGAGLVNAHIASGPNMNGNLTLCLPTSYNCADAWQILVVAGGTLYIRNGAVNSLILNNSGTTLNTPLTVTSTGIVQFLTVNGDDGHIMQRFTDSAPTGSFEDYRNAASATVWKLDVTGTVTTGTVPAARVSSGTLGAAQMPAFTGAITTSAGAVAASAGKADLLDSQNFCSDAGASDTYACSLSPAITGYVTGTHYRFKANTANTGAASINFNSLGAATIKKVAGGITTDLADNDIRVGQWVDMVYDGTNMQMQSTLGNAASGGSGTVPFPFSLVSSTGTMTAGSTYYFGAGGNTGAGMTTTETQVQTPMPVAGTVSGMFMHMVNAASGGTAVLTFTVMSCTPNGSGTCTGSASTVTCAVTGTTNNTCNDTGHSFAFSQGDFVYMRIQPTVANTNGTYIEVTLKLTGVS